MLQTVAEVKAIVAVAMAEEEYVEVEAVVVVLAREEPAREVAQAKILCQICKKGGHEAPQCWYRYDDDEEQENTKTAGTATTSYGYDSNWYVDSGASEHVTSDLEKLTVRDKYSGRDQVHTANGAGMKISNIGHTILHTPKRKLHLKNILHVPSASKNLVSVNKLAIDNNAFPEFHPNFFLIKDKEMKTTLHQGRCRGGLYPQEPQLSRRPAHKQAYGVNKPSTSKWHSRLGHPALPIVESCQLK